MSTITCHGAPRTLSFFLEFGYGTLWFLSRSWNQIAQALGAMAMEDGKVLITGACGFLGNLLARNLAPHHPNKLILLSHDSPPPSLVSGAHYVTGDIADEKVLESVITEDVRSIYHLAALASSRVQTNYELGLKVNIDGTRAIIKRCKDLGHCPRLVFTSSVAVFGPLPASVVEGVDGGRNFTDTTTAYPLSSYGSQKLICELLISDATRKGFVDGRCLRLPGIIVRPGRPSTAASSFYSSIIREPLRGETAVCPVDPNCPLFVQSPRTVVRNLKHAMTIKSLKGNERAITLSGLTTTPKEMVEALGTAGGDTKLVKWEFDAAVQKMIQTLPGFVDTPFARSLGFHVDRNMNDIVTAYIEDNQTQ